MAQESRVTSSRIGRLGLLGRLAGGIAGSVVTEGAKQYVRGGSPSLGDLVLTPANARQLGEKLSQMRGAAMKVGQLLSMDSGHLLPPEFSAMLQHLREDAHSMPLGEVASVLDGAWGKDWSDRFARFSFTPMASASIGQVHDATLKNGQRVAVKIQYPGVKDSIDSDVDNVATLLRIFRVIPEPSALEDLLTDAKTQLHFEADYIQEANSIRQFTRRLGVADPFELPEVVDALTTPEILTMSYLDGAPIESLSDHAPEVRDHVASQLLHLAFREVFEWGLVQTDPNFSNYLFDRESGKIQLLDFGATRAYPDEQRQALGNLLSACFHGRLQEVETAARDVGYIQDGDTALYVNAIVELLHTATEPLRSEEYHFGGKELAERMRDLALDIRQNLGFARIPPPAILFLHRKLGGLYLLISRLGARVRVRDLATPFSAHGEPTTTRNQPAQPEALVQ